MRIIEPSVEILTDIDPKNILQTIEKAGRTCYKSEEKITEDSAVKFVGMLIKRNHLSVLEHCSVTFKFTTNRSVTHQQVRHRLASYSQESQRYVKYGDIDVVKTQGIPSDKRTKAYKAWKLAMDTCEKCYGDIIDAGFSPEIARSVLPNDAKTEIVCTMNLRSIRHFLEERGSRAAQQDIRKLALCLCRQLKMLLPVVFDDFIEINGCLVKGGSRAARKG